MIVNENELEKMLIDSGVDGIVARTIIDKAKADQAAERQAAYEKINKEQIEQERREAILDLIKISKYGDDKPNIERHPKIGWFWDKVYIDDIDKTSKPGFEVWDVHSYIGGVETEYETIDIPMRWLDAPDDEYEKIVKYDIATMVFEEEIKKIKNGIYSFENQVLRMQNHLAKKIDDLTNLQNKQSEHLKGLA